MEIGVRRAEAARRRKSAGGDPQGEGAPPPSGSKLRPPGRLASCTSCIGTLPAPGNPRGLNPP